MDGFSDVLVFGGKAYVGNVEFVVGFGSCACSWGNFLEDEATVGRPALQGVRCLCSVFIMALCSHSLRGGLPLRLVYPV